MFFLRPPPLYYPPDDLSEISRGIRSISPQIELLWLLRTFCAVKNIWKGKKGNPQVEPWEWNDLNFRGILVFSWLWSDQGNVREMLVFHVVDFTTRKHQHFPYISLISSLHYVEVIKKMLGNAVFLHCGLIEETVGKSGGRWKKLDPGKIRRRWWLFSWLPAVPP